MRRAMAGGTLALGLALAGCGPDWQPSWDVSSRPRPVGDSLTVRRVTGQETEFAPLRSENPEQLRLSAGLLQGSRPATPEAALTSVPEYRPVPRPDIDAQTAPPARSEAPPPPRPRGSSTPPSALAAPPPPERQREPPREVRPLPAPPPSSAGRVVTIPGEPSGMVTGGGRVEGFTQPGNPAGGIAIQDGGTTTIIQPGGRVTTVPTPR